MSLSPDLSIDSDSAIMTGKEQKTVDIHTHIYPPAYLTLLRSRTAVPYLLDLPNKSLPPRLIILPSDDDPSLPPESRGRPIDASYSSVAEKLRFMDNHHITTSVISLANPWLDFLDPADGLHWADTVNDELESICQKSSGRLYAFATLPLSAAPHDVALHVRGMKSRPSIKGIILGTTGLGSGLDDPDLDAVWAALEKERYLIFLHPHYGLPKSVYGPRASDYGHVLPLALGFPMETTIAFTRMFLSGVFDHFPDLKILIAHAGGTVPFLAGRIDSCVQHERHLPENSITGIRGPTRSLSQVLEENIWLDAVVYSSTSVDAAVELVGRERVLFGTDHPFFPPLTPLKKGNVEWESWRTNMEAVTDRQPRSTIEMVLGQNAIELLGLDVSEARVAATSGAGV